MYREPEGKTIVIFGGNGFIGRYLIQTLSKYSCKIIIITRKSHNHEKLRLLAGLGQISIIVLNEYSEEGLAKILKDCDIVINLIGILAENKKDKFLKVHEQIPDMISKIAKDLSIKRFVHLSALGVNKIKNSKYAISKFQGETKVFKNFPSATVIRPSVVFGDEDNFINLFSKIANFLPFLPIFGAPQISFSSEFLDSIFTSKVKFQPIYVGDLVKFIIGVLDKKGQTYDLTGPSIYTFDEIIKLVLRVKRKRRILFPVPLKLASLMGSILEKLPFQILTKDQVILMMYDNISSKGFSNLKKFIKNPKSMEIILPTYIR